MKNMNYVVNGVLAVAVIILFILQFTGKKDTKAAVATFTSDGDPTALLPIAYVDMDSLLLNYNYYNDLLEVIMKKQENSRANINQQASKLQTEIQDFERKIQNNAFLTRQRAEEEQQRLMKKQQELEALDNRLARELMEEQQKLTEQLRDSLLAQLKIYNADRKFQVIFSSRSTDVILLANDAYNITDEILDHLNKNYNPSTK
ncbi:outer membrane protein [Parabacteroides sp. PF5-5]|uniref:OmpH family outer membrane protein n=1 Tax=unclassified Parabacteroides TaxID=2649774 RepID=UPI002473D96D|nr:MULTISPECIES: OmpH family outer membrane protein [unclassified Parabacteroides]MDH6305102.1 outer membrane protein [Parabacteroides sp. PH5-39]MDH6316452.1 outer membrane protein [Parabacteroides sp. PF5-13]MDH6319962.1 outer membrane protein [Parabacteroides sp. PH5-13]MDH6323805.1 outer membrane protein [Parabacteroides sp. PH5-8]MDH6327639.1 outer membrane protein [Parabacteroides sp. PH5-41]